MVSEGRTSRVLGTCAGGSERLSEGGDRPCAAVCGEGPMGCLFLYGLARSLNASTVHGRLWVESRGGPRAYLLATRDFKWTLLVADDGSRGCLGV